MSDASKDLPLTDLKVVDFSRLLPGPWATQTLADMGADVIKVEQPGVGDYGRFNPPNYQTLGVYFNSVNRNKRSVVLDLSNSHALEAALKLIAEADVVVESFRPGVTHKLGIDYVSVRALNPGLIYCSITGFGQVGSLAGLPAHDMAVQALSGVMGNALEANAVPPMPCFQAGDYAPAAYAITGIMGALMKRMKSAQGCHLDIAMFDAMFVWSNIALTGAIARLTGVSGKPELEAWGNNPRYNTYLTRDGKAVGVCLLETRTWQVFCDRIQRPDLYSDDETYSDRHTDHGTRERAYREAIADLCLSRDRDELCEEMMMAGIPICPVYRPDEAVVSPLVKERGLLEEVEHPTEGLIPQPVNPLSAAGLADSRRRPSPQLGADTEAVLKELGYDDAACRQIVAGPSG